MLITTRMLDEKITLTDDNGLKIIIQVTKITVKKSGKHQVKIGIDAPSNIKINRGDIEKQEE